MNKEGHGMVPPKAVPIHLEERHIIASYKFATRAAKLTRYSRRRDAWGASLSEGRNFPYVGFVEKGPSSFLIGKLGEFAFADYLAKRTGKIFSPDMSIGSHGDGGIDFQIGGHGIDVKTSTSSHEFLVRASRSDGFIISLLTDVYVFVCYGQTGTKDAMLMGWLSSREVAESDIVTSRAGHKNYRILPKQLQPMSRLIGLVAKDGGYDSWRS